METDREKLIAYLKFLNLPLDPSNSRDRFKIQKMAFLLKSMGAELNYEFTFYQHGVYSSKLFKESLDHKDDFALLKSNYKINDNERMILDKLRDDIPDNDLMEAITTIIYENIVYSDMEEIIKRVKKLKPHLNDSIIISAVDLAKRFLFKNEYLTEEIKREIEAWDNFD
jgi:uncharacterized protein YwgA